jgi:hypothetical protein
LGDVKIRIKASLQGRVVAQVPIGAPIEKFEAQSATTLANKDALLEYEIKAV